MVRKQFPLWLLFISLLTFGACSTPALQPPILQAYIQSLNESNIPALNEQVIDSITITEGDFTIVKNKAQFTTHCQWDSTFQPKYELLSSKATPDRIVAVVAKTCQRIHFLHDSAIVYKVAIGLKNNKITHISTEDYINFNVQKWQNRRDSLTTWINDNHPELSGCIHDLTPTGAVRYMKAIELYRAAILTKTNH